ncbi:MAG TPA: metal-dependent transcriptional regulator [Actinomycetaceae bacterium]|nr:metal-dependent transcriptional regulator [Actinomycetaceae bacterium]
MSAAKQPRTPGEPAGVEDITPAAQDFIKAVWAATEWGDPPITTTRLAKRLGSSSANVSETARRLASQGLIHYQPYRPVSLTTRGERLALAMIRRHRLLETFLVQVLGYSWDEVHDDAERLEHAVSPRLVERIDAHLGHPDSDPHGDPIPLPDGRHTSPRSLRLADAGPGTYEITRVSDDDPALLAQLAALELVPGAVISNDDAGNVRTTTSVGSGAAIALPDGASTAIRVRPGEPPRVP